MNSKSLNQPWLTFCLYLFSLLEQKVKDVTCRYAEKWLGVNRKLRVDRDWWAETLQPYAPRNDTLNKSEDAQLKQELLKQDFPTTISEFKNHPLYALKRHLLKFEAIYPESAVPLGYIRGEEIYSRDCVHEVNFRYRSFNFLLAQNI